MVVQLIGCSAEGTRGQTRTEQVAASTTQQFLVGVKDRTEQEKGSCEIKSVMPSITENNLSEVSQWAAADVWSNVGSEGASPSEAIFYPEGDSEAGD
ncbi:hypothetical protein RRG08_022562 [Elysia crispata]|uniref:Uncharacterized protein n=1 Tax=Elysia crispata TaxID=231223 RepID=A0AAE1D9A7_9GAST|nr:hypothetical protein RRG08_022562 [Elysia crispata]